jgi:putative sigma-54 modulation protein
MMLTIQSINFEATDRLEGFIRSKVGKISGLHDRITDTKVYLKVEKNKSKDQGNKVVEMKVLAPNVTLHASEQCRTFEEAADLCVDQIRRQLIKFKEKNRT